MRCTTGRSRGDRETGVGESSTAVIDGNGAIDHCQGSDTIFASSYSRATALTGRIETIEPCY